MEEIEIDYEYINSKLFKGRFVRFLPFIVYTNLKKLELNDKVKLLDGKLVFFHPSKYYDYLWFYYYSVFFAVGYLVLSLFHFGFDFNLVFWFFLISSILLAFYFKKKSKKIPKDDIKVIFNREKSIITLPRFHTNESFNIPFSELKAVIKRMTSVTLNITGFQIHFFNTSKRYYSLNEMYLNIENFGSNADAWSLYVWFMDKNRPLPPVSIFDAYREEDYQRRKSEGFPSPLFKSIVATPEATKEQQAERECFWKDEDYIVTKEEATFSMNMFHSDSWFKDKE